MRQRAGLLSMRTVRERLDAWLSFGGSLPGRGGWRSLADDLGITPEALYREIARRRSVPPGGEAREPGGLPA
jgi:hypothetical protein